MTDRTKCAENLPLPFLNFIFQLREEGLSFGLNDVLDFYRGMEKGLISDIDQLFIFGRLCFVRKVENYDLFHRIFQRYFYNIHLPPVAEGDPRLLQTKAFADWLQQAIDRGEMKRHQLWSLSREELMRRFWDTVKAQMEAHHGGNRWVGTGGTSPFGHSGFSQRGVRVGGDSRRRSALHTFGDRRYISYDDTQTLDGENLRQALATLKHLKPVGAADVLNIEETIRQTAKNGGEIELIFNRETRDRLRLVVLFDNGGQSMLPFVTITRLLFSKIKHRFKDYQAFYFHNTIFKNVYQDEQRTEPFPTEKLLQQPEDTRVFVVGDACMAPEELVSPYGAQAWEDSDETPSVAWLERIKARFPYSVWLNPVPRNHWATTHGAWTLKTINKIFHMEDLSLGGIKQAVEFLSKSHSP